MWAKFLSLQHVKKKHCSSVFGATLDAAPVMMLMSGERAKIIRGKKNKKKLVLENDDEKEVLLLRH